MNENITTGTVTDQKAKHDDFVSRLEFINATGVFVTPQYFEIIYLDFKSARVPAEEFIRDYEAKYSTCIMKTEMIGTLKYEIADDCISGVGNSDLCDENNDPNIMEVLNTMALALNQRR